MVVDKKALDFLLKYVLVVSLITGVWLAFLIPSNPHISENDVEIVTVTIVDSFVPYRSRTVFYVGSDGNEYSLPSWFFDNDVVVAPIVGQTFECGVINDVFLTNGLEIVSCKSNGSNIKKDWTIEQSNREYQKRFLWLFIPFISIIVLGFFGLLYEVYLPNFKKSRELRKKLKKHKKKLDRKEKYEEKFKTKTEDDVVEWKHTQKNTSKKKLKRRKNNSENNKSK